jgi:hypothetical protein
VFAQAVQLVRVLIVYLTGLFLCLYDISFFDKLANRRGLDHKVDFVAARALELDWTDRDVAVEISPAVTHSLVGLKHLTIEFDKSLLNDRLVLSLSALDSHHSG